MRKKVLSWPLCEGAFRAITGDRPIDDRGVDLLDGVITQPESFHNPRPEVLDNHIGLLNQIHHFGKVVTVFQVRRVTVFISIGDVEGQGVAILHDPPESKTSADIPGGWTLDFDDARAQVTQTHRRHRTGKELGEVKDEETLEWLGRCHV